MSAPAISAPNSTIEVCQNVVPLGITTEQNGTPPVDIGIGGSNLGPELAEVTPVAWE